MITYFENDGFNDYEKNGKFINLDESPNITHNKKTHKTIKQLKTTQNDLGVQIQ